MTLSGHRHSNPRYKMADAKIYLNVPYAQKDIAKALGARWDATYKKWYVSGDRDIALFTQWRNEAVDLASPTVATNSSKTRAPIKNSTATKNSGSGAITRAKVTGFTAYNGDEPPWD